MNDLLRRVEIVYAKCADEPDVKEKKEKIDDFTKVKRDCTSKIREIREDIKERENLLQSNPNSTETVRLNASIRNKLKAAKEDSSRLDNLYQKQATKKNKSEKSQEQLSLKRDVVTSITQHIDECERANKKTITANSATRQMLFSDTGFGGDSPGLDNREGGIDYSKSARNMSLEEIESLDMGQELTDGMMQIKKKDQEMDNILDNISNGIHDLKNIAVDMGTEIDKQQVMLDQVENKVDKVQEHLETINTKMYNTLKKVRKADRIIIDLILLAIILALLGVVYNTVMSVLEQLGVKVNPLDWPIVQEYIITPVFGSEGINFSFF